MTIQRRGFLASILATGFAPAVVGSGILMPVRDLGGCRTITLPQGEVGDFDDFINLGQDDLTIRAGARSLNLRPGQSCVAVKWSAGWQILPTPLP